MYDGPVIDCDIHYLPRSEADWHRYLPAQWREFVESPGSGRTAPVTGAFISVTEQQDGVFRLDSFPQDGTPPGADYELMCEQYWTASTSGPGFSPGRQDRHRPTANWSRRHAVPGTTGWRRSGWTAGLTIACAARCSCPPMIP